MSSSTASVQAAEMALGIARRGGRSPSTIARDTNVVWGLGLLLLVAVSIRLLLIWLGPMGDGERALDDASEPLLATAAAFAGGGFLAPMSSEGLTATGLRTPVYPVIVALMGATGLPLAAVLLMQAAAWAGVVAAAYGVATMLCGSARSGLVAATLVAIHPAGWIATASLLPESIAIGLLAAGVWVVVNVERRTMGATALGGGAIGIAALAAPISFALGPVLACWIAVTDRRWRGLAAAVAFAAASLTPGALWLARNAAAGASAPPMISLITPASPTVGLHPQRLVAVMTGQAFEQVCARVGVTAPAALPATPLDVQWDAVPALASTPALAWIVLGVALTAAAVLGGASLFFRGRLAALLLGVALLTGAMLLPTGEAAWRGQAMIVLPLSILAAGVFAEGEFIRRRRRRADTPETIEVDDEPVRDGRPL